LPTKDKENYFKFIISKRIFTQNIADPRTTTDIEHYQESIALIYFHIYAVEIRRTMSDNEGGTRLSKPAYRRVRDKLTKREAPSKKDWTEWYESIKEEPKDVPNIEKLLNAYPAGQNSLDDFEVF
jgi:hypothetical protein